MAVKVALLGVGNMGQNHLRILSMLKDVEVVSIYDVNEDSLKQLSEKYRVPYTLSLDEALVNADAAVIATPTSTHCEYFQKCAEYVNNVFVEKPLATNLEEASTIQRLAEEKGVFIQCGFIERFNPVVTELKRIVKDENVINADFTRTNRLSSRITDVDVVLDLMIHDIDLALHINGPVKKVIASGKHENGLVAFASAHFTHSNGALSRVLASRMTEKKMRQIQVTTDESYIDAELLRKEVIIHKQSTVAQEEGKPYVISSLEQQVAVQHREALLAEHQAFIAKCMGEDVSVPDLYDGLESLKISEMILEQIKNDA